LIEEHKLTEQFQSQGLTAIVNLQLPGEHPYCGDGVLSSGFSYLPEELYAAGLYFYNFGWPDMKTPSFDLIFGVVKVMAFTINGGGKAAVHCHAGTGRTCLGIACYLVYNEGMSAQDAITLVRSTRRGSLSDRAQRNFIASFWSCKGYPDLVNARLLFGVQRTLKQVLDFQGQLLHGAELKALKSCPKLLHKVVEMTLPEEAEEVFCRPQAFLEPRVSYVKVRTTQQALNTGNWQAFLDESAGVRAWVLLDWLGELQPPLLFEVIPTQLAGKSIQECESLSSSQKDVLKRLNGLCAAVASSPLSERLAAALLGGGVPREEVSSLAGLLTTSVFT
jgi:hypothetical protein